MDGDAASTVEATGAILEWMRLWRGQRWCSCDASAALMVVRRVQGRY